MNFQSLPVVEKPDDILEIAFSRAKRKAFGIGKKKAINKVSIVQDNIISVLDRIIKEFPDFNNLNEFYEELCRTQLNIEDVKNSLGRLQGLINTIREISTKTKNKIKEEDESKIKKTLNVYYGRVSALLKRASSAFNTLEEARRILKTFPSIKELYTIAIAGFPNVGKSTLLSKLTSAKPEIKNYAFTTKKLNTGYYKDSFEKIQVIDTPGTLARFDKMNKIEQQAYLCLKYLANIIIFVFDPTETYSFDEQEKLLEQVKDHDKDLIIYVSKTDIADEKKVLLIKEKHPDAITNLSDLKHKIKLLRKNY